MEPGSCTLFVSMVYFYSFIWLQLSLRLKIKDYIKNKVTPSNNSEEGKKTEKKAVTERNKILKEVFKLEEEVKEAKPQQSERNATDDVHHISNPEKTKEK